MDKAPLETSKPSEILMGFPRYRRSHLKSETFRTLVCILSHCCDESRLSGSNQVRFDSQELKNLDNGTERGERESQEKDSGHSNIDGDGTDIMDPRDPVPHKETQVLETLEGVNVHGREFTEESMMGVQKDEGFSGMQVITICESESTEAVLLRDNGLKTEQKQIDELNQIVEGTEKLVCENGLSPLDSWLCEKQSGSSEIDLMDYQLEYVEFKGTESELQVDGEFNQQALEGFHASLTPDISTFAKYQNPVPAVKSPSELAKPICAAISSLPSSVLGEFGKEEEHGQKVLETIQFFVDQGVSSESVNLSGKHGRQEEERELVNRVCAATSSLLVAEVDEFGKEEEDGLKVPETIQFSVDPGVSSEAVNLSAKHGRQKEETELVNRVCAATSSLPVVEVGDFGKEEEHGLKVPETIQFSVHQGMSSEALNLSAEHGRQEKKTELVNTACAATSSFPVAEVGEFEKEQQYSQKVSEAMNLFVDHGMTSDTSNLSMKHERPQKEMESVKPISAAMNSLPATREDDFEKGEPHGPKVPDTMHFFVDPVAAEEFNLSEYDGETKSILDIDMLEAKHVMQPEEQPEKIISANDDTRTFSNNSNKEGDVEEGEISGEIGMEDIPFDMSSADSLMLQQRKDEVQNPKNVIENIAFGRNKEKEDSCKLVSFMVHAPQDDSNTGQVEPWASDNNGFQSGVNTRISREIINYGDLDLVEQVSVLKTGRSKGRHSGTQEAVDLPAALPYDQVHRGFLKEEATADQQNASAGKKAGINCKKKRGPVTEETKAKKKEKKRKKRAETNRKLGVKRLKLHPLQKPKTISYCRHYLKGRCQEGDKCKFSHDIVPETKSKPCCHFARHSCMKGDDCPFDHQLSKYPCSNFAVNGSCIRGDSCLFSHQMATKQDIPTLSNDSKPGMKHQLKGNTNLSKPLSIGSSGASQQKHLSDSKGTQSHSSSSSQQKNLSDSKGIQSHIILEHEVIDTLQKPRTLPPKGISFINVSKSSPLNPNTPKQGMLTPNKESVAKIGTFTDQSASGVGVAHNIDENPKKTSAVVPKGNNFLSFGKGHVCSFKSSVSSFFNRESGINMSKRDDFCSPGQSSSSVNKDDCSKVGDGTKQNRRQENHSVAEGINLLFPGKSSMDHPCKEVQNNFPSYQEPGLSKSVQGVKAKTSQTSTMTSPMLSVSPFVYGQSSERLASANHKYVFNSGQRALLSTLSFAAEHESDIKMSSDR